MTTKFFKTLKPRTQQCLWFVGLYLGSLATVASFCYGFRLLIPNLHP